MIDHTERDAHAPLGWVLVASLSLPLCRNGKGCCCFSCTMDPPGPDEKQRKTTKKWTAQAGLLTTNPRLCLCVPALSVRRLDSVQRHIHDVSGSRPADPGTLAMPSIMLHALSLFGQTAAERG